MNSHIRALNKFFGVSKSIRCLFLKDDLLHYIYPKVITSFLPNSNISSATIRKQNVSGNTLATKNRIAYALPIIQIM